MLHSKATAALMKLKEIDKKYKMKSSEELARQRHSLTDISAVDSFDEISNSVAPPGSSDSHDAIARPKLDIRMPEAHMERTAAAVDGIEPPAELVTIFDKSEKNSPPSSQKSTKAAENRTAGLAGEENYTVSHRLNESSSSHYRDDSLKEEHTANTETSISEEVHEAVPSTPRFSSSSSFTPGRKVTTTADKKSTKSVDSSSVISSEGWVQSFAEKNSSSTSKASEMYSDDFIETTSKLVSSVEGPLSSSVNEKKATVKEGENVVASAGKIREPRAKLFANSLPAQKQPQQFLANHEGETIELVAPKTMSRVLSECDASLDPALRHYVKSMENRGSGNEDFKDPVRLLSRSLQPASARDGKTRRKKGRRRAVTSRNSEASMSREFSSSSEQRTDSAIGRTLEMSKKPSEIQESRKLMEESREENSAVQISRNLKEEMPKTITRKKIPTKIKTENAKNRTRVEASSIAESALKHSNECGETRKSTSPIRPVIPSGDDKRKLRTSETQKGHSKKGRREENFRTIHWKNRMRKKWGSLTEESSDRIGEIVTKEVCHQREETDRLRARVRGFIQQIMEERERLLVPDGPGVPVDKHARCTHGASRLRQSESLRRYFFKPLDLPNVAAFKRPDFEERNGPDPTRNEEYKNFFKIRDRVFDIRYWLNQQFVLYKDYTNLALTINAKYVPVTLKQTKKMIHDMQRYRNGSERCSNCQRLK